MKNKKQRIIIEFECPNAFMPFIMRKLNDALLEFESVEKPRIKDGDC